MDLSNCKHGAEIRLLRFLFFLLITSTVVWGFEKKNSWEKTLAAQRVRKEVAVQSWKIIGPFHPAGSGPAICPYPPELNPDTSAVYLQKGRRLRWTQAKPGDDFLRIRRREHGTFFVSAAFQWAEKRGVLIRFETDDAERLEINGKTAWAKGHEHGNVDTVFPVTLRKKNTLFVKTYGYDSFLRVTICVEEDVRKRIDLLLFLCSAFPRETQRILSAAREIRESLDIYHSYLDVRYRETSLRSLCSSVEKCLEIVPTAEMITYYLDFRAQTDLQPLNSQQVRDWIRSCSEQQNRLLYKLARLNVTSFANRNEGWQFFRQLAANREFYPKFSKGFTLFCNKNEYYHEGAEILLSGVDALGPETRLSVLFRAGILYRNAGDYDRALDCFDKITATSGSDEFESGQRQQAIKDVQKEVVGIFRNVNKDSTSILPEAIGLKNFMEYIGKKAQKKDISRAVNELRKEIPKYRNTAIRLDKKRAVGGMRYIAEKCRSFPREFQNELYAALGNTITGMIEQRGYDDCAALRSVMNGFPTTVKACSLIRGVVRYLFQKGDVAAALSWYNMLSDISPDPDMLLSIGYGCCLRRDSVGLERLINTVRGKKSTEPVFFKGRKMSLVNAVKALSAEISERPPSATEEDIPVGSGPYLNISSDDFLLYQVGERHKQYVRPVCVPVRKGDVLYVYTGMILMAWNVKTGTVLWSVPVNLHTDIISGTPVPVFRILVRGRMLYIRIPGQSFGLNAYDRFTGRVIWSTSDIHRTRGLHMASDPVFCNGLIVFVGARHHWWSRAITNTELFAVALKPRTGELMWKQLLVSGDSRYGEEYLSSQLPRPVETPHGIFIQTNRKVFHMLDPISGTIQWVRSYHRSKWQFCRDHLFVNPVVCDGDTVVAAPRDSSFIYSVNVRTGDIRWSTSRGRTPIVCGTVNGMAVMLGQGIRLLDMNTGDERKSVRFRSMGEFVLPVLRGSLLWISGQNHTVLMNTRSMKDVSADPAITQNRTLPVDNGAAGFTRNSIRFHSGKKEAESASHFEKAFTERTGPNTLSLRTDLKKKITTAPRAKKPARTLTSIKPVLCWQRPVNMTGWSFPEKKKNRILLWNKSCVCLSETDYFGTRLWEYSYDPNGFHVRSVQAVGDHVLIQGSWKMVCLDMNTGRMQWTIQMPMPLNGIRNTKDTVYVLLAESHYKHWQTGILDMKKGKITYFARGDAKKVPIVWYHPDWMIMRIGKGYSAVDILNGQTLWRYETDTRRYRFGYLVSAPDKLSALLYLCHDNRYQLLESHTGREIFAGKGWPFLPAAYSGNGKYYFYHKGRTQERIWDSGKQTLVKKWSRDIRGLDWVKPSNYGFIDNRIVILNQSRDNYLDLYQVDPESGRKGSHQKLFKLSGRHGSLQVGWKALERKLFLMTDRMLYCLRYPEDQKQLVDWNKTREGIYASGFQCPENALSIKRTTATLSGWHPVYELDKKPLRVSGRRYWFPASHKQTANQRQNPYASVELSCEQIRGHLHVTARVEDDQWTPVQGNGGDRLIFSTGRYAIRIGMNRNLQPVLNGLDSRYIRSYDCRMLEDGRIEYTVTIDADRRLFYTYYAPSDNERKRFFSMNVSYHDDDGEGVRGFLVWPCLNQWGTGRCNAR